jgi:hypothetical protein
MRSHRRDCEGMSSILGMGPPMPCHIFGDRGLTNFDAELEEFAVDPGSTPQRIGETHCPDQLANFERHLWSAAAKSRLPSPEGTKTSTMPADNRLRLDDHQGIHNAQLQSCRGRKNEAIEIAKNEPLWRFSSQHIELVAQRNDLALSHYQIEHVRNLPHFGFMPLQRLHATFAGPMPRKLGAFLLR